MPKVSLEKFRKQAKDLVQKKDVDLLKQYFPKIKIDEFKLHHAQLIIARENGFNSWPKLVKSFEEITNIKIDPKNEYQIEFGHGLINFVDKYFLNQLSIVRMQIFSESNIKIPPIRIRDHMGLKLTEMNILFNSELLNSKAYDSIIPKDYKEFKLMVSKHVKNVIRDHFMKQQGY